jgi:hypothetical protein
MKKLTLFCTIIFCSTILNSCSNTELLPSESDISSNPSNSSNGEVMVWTRNNADVDVEIKGVMKHTTATYSSVPACGSSGCATFSLPPGTYSIYTYVIGSFGAYQDTFTIKKGECKALERN